MMAERAATHDEEPKIVVEFYPADPAAAEFVKQSFPNEEIFESNAFSGVQIITVIVAATRQAVGAVLEFFALHRQNYRDALVKIGPNEITLKGYTSEEVKSLFDSSAMQKLLKELKKT